MRARVLYRTHYQVEEPAYIELLVSRCTSPVQAAYSERVAKKLSNEVSKRGGRFNVAAAAYALDLGRGLGVLNESNTWTDKGQLLALNATVQVDKAIEADFPLDATERLTHFRLFLEGDGAAFLYIARVALSGTPIPVYPAPGKGGERERNWNRFAREMFEEIYKAYLATTTDIADRLALRKDLERLRAPFRGRTGDHKSFVHLQTLLRMGLLSRSEGTMQREYAVASGAEDGLKALLRHIPNVAVLEQVVQRGSWAEVAADLFGIHGTATVGPVRLIHIAVGIYGRVIGTGVPLCPLSTLCDAVQIYLLTSGARLMSQAEILAVFTAIQKQRPADLRFHVDRKGRPAFLKLSPGLVNEFEGGEKRADVGSTT